MMTTQSVALTPREKRNMMYTYIYIYIYIFPKFFPLGVVIRLRAMFAENITLRPSGQQLLKLLCSWDSKTLGTHAVVIFWVVR